MSCSLRSLRKRQLHHLLDLVDNDLTRCSWTRLIDQSQKGVRPVKQPRALNAGSFKQPPGPSGKGVRDDALSFVDDAFEVGFVFEAFGVDLVEILSA